MKLSTSALAYCFIVFAAFYGNCLKEQRHFMDFHVNQLYTDLMSIDIVASEEPVKIRILGNIGYTNSVYHYLNSKPDHQMLKKLLVNPGYGENWACIFYTLYHYGMRNAEMYKQYQDNEGFTPVINNRYHYIEVKDNIVNVILKNQNEIKQNITKAMN